VDLQQACVVDLAAVAASEEELTLVVVHVLQEPLETLSAGKDRPHLGLGLEGL
jgi:hypothetical protein